MPGFLLSRMDVYNFPAPCVQCIKTPMRCATLSSSFPSLPFIFPVAGCGKLAPPPSFFSSPFFSSPGISRLGLLSSSSLPPPPGVLFAGRSSGRRGSEGRRRRRRRRRRPFSSFSRLQPPSPSLFPFRLLLRLLFAYYACQGGEGGRMEREGKAI